MTSDETATLHGPARGPADPAAALAPTADASIPSLQRSFAVRAVEHWIGPHRLYVEGREPQIPGPAAGEDGRARVQPAFGRPAILFMGGAFDGSWIFRKEMDFLASKGWRVFAVNPRGYYKSRWTDVASLTVEDYLSDLRLTQQQLGLEPVILAGYSMGGLLALKHAERHGAFALILYDSDPSRQIWQELGRRPPGHRIPPVVRFWPSHAILEEMVGGRVGRRKYLEYLDLFKQTAVSGQSFRITEFGGLDIHTDAIGCPALVIGIRSDEDVQSEWFRRLNASWLVFEGNSHGSILVGPRARTITEEIVRWLDSVEAGAADSARRKRIFPVLGYISPDRQMLRTRLFYFTAWDSPSVEVQAAGKRPAIRVKMEPVGRGRVSGERLHEATLTLHRKSGFFIRQNGQEDRPPAGALYRPVGSSLYLADGELYEERPPATISKPRYLDREIYSDRIQRFFRVHVLLPRNYRTDRRPYPICILNDGQNQWKNQGAYGGWHTDVITTDLIRKGRCREVVLVSVESTRMNRNRFFLSPPTGRADLYVNFLADCLLPAIRKEFHLTSYPGQTGIVGSSYGAYCAVYAGLLRPDVFGLIGSLSYAEPRYKPLLGWIRRHRQLPFRKFYVDCGTRWTTDQKNHRTDNTSLTIELIRLAQGKGLVAGRSMLGLIARNHSHREPDWRRRIGGCMQFLFSLVN